MIGNEPSPKFPIIKDRRDSDVTRYMHARVLHFSLSTQSFGLGLNTKEIPSLIFDQMTLFHTHQVNSLFDEPTEAHCPPRVPSAGC